MDELKIMKNYENLSYIIYWYMIMIMIMIYDLYNLYDFAIINIFFFFVETF